MDDPLPEPAAPTGGPPPLPWRLVRTLAHTPLGELVVAEHQSSGTPALLLAVPAPIALPLLHAHPLPPHPHLLALQPLHASGDVHWFELVASETNPDEPPPALPHHTLADRFQHDPTRWPIVDARTVISGCLSCLAHAHHHGQTHACLDPTLILITPENQPLVAGFGFAPPDADPAADIHALGWIALPILGEPSEPTEAGADAALVVPDEEWKEWLEHTLATDPTDRWPSASVALKALPPPPVAGPDTRPLTLARKPLKLRKLFGTLAILSILAAFIIGAVRYGPQAHQWWMQRQTLRLAQTHTAEALQHLHAGRLEPAEASARQALHVLPGHRQALDVIATAQTIRLQLHQREKDTADALAAAEKLATNDDIPAAIAAYQTLRNDPTLPPAVAKQADSRIAALQQSTGTLRLPDDWPDDAILYLDGSPRRHDNKLVAPIPLGSRTLSFLRHGFRSPPPVTLEFRGTQPLPLPPPAWTPAGGKVRLSSTPPGARVWTDKGDTGLATPCTIDDAGPGKVRFVLKLEGHEDFPLEGTVESLQTIDLSAKLALSPLLPSGDGSQPGEARLFNLAPGLRAAFRWCPPGTFLMGGADPAASREEKPVRKITFPKGFWISETEVTQSQWQTVTGQSFFLLQSLAYRGSKAAGEGPDHPVYFVSWDHICGDPSRNGGFLGHLNSFLRQRGVQTWTADLPTEAQWEYACRAGTTGPFAAPDPAAFDRMAWHASNSGGEARPVGTKDPNAWGIRDMHGNVLEWCRDWFQPNYRKLPDINPAGPDTGWHRVVRGGSRNSLPARCRSAARDQAAPSAASALVGFRIVLRHTDS